MRTIAINTKSDNIFKFNILNKKQFTNKANVCEQPVRIALRYQTCKKKEKAFLRI